ncbi:hypothetical protein [Streptomyces alkaliphilus]|uniref:hypothetical protein n=1 Tax=Streptomyces alkaliphilus TaxID=1472722 RepID=UPI00117C44E9|nr:hypothetical protein [Streptomyces alkaliphilus]MQS06910.1 hypothetical protein [Streptomyces alkaliphilus]
MSHRRTRAALTVPIITALALLTACGGSDPTDGTDGNAAPIKGADTPDTEAEEKSEEPEAPTTENEDGIERPEIVLPDDMVNVFEDTETGDPEKDAILADLQRFINAVDLAVAESDPHHEAVLFYGTGSGLERVQNYIRHAADSGEAGRTWVGVTEYYDFAVFNEERTDPYVTFCIDSSQGQTKDLATGEIVEATPGGQGFEKYFMRPSDNGNGVWQVVSIVANDEESDTRCRR